MDELAIFGGAPACAAGLVPRWPMSGESELAAVRDVLESGKWWRVAGDQVAQLEREFAEFHDAPHALMVSSGTAALEIALASAGIGRGDEVIVPAMTFCATATAVLAAGATAVAVDVSRDSYCIDPDAVRAAITPRTRAIVPVHFAGHAADLHRLQDIAAESQLEIIADAAHAHGARYAGASITAAARASIFSFQAMKLLTAGEGGAIVTHDPELMERAWLFHTSGRPRGDRRYRHVELAANHRMSELHGAVLRAQLARFAGQLRQREEAAARLDAQLGEIGAFRVLPRDPEVSTHSHYMYMVELADGIAITRDAVVDALNAEGVPAFRAYPALPDLEFFAEDVLQRGLPPAPDPAAAAEAMHRHDVPVSREIAARALWLHHAILLGEAEVQERVALAFAKIARHARRAAAGAAA